MIKIQSHYYTRRFDFSDEDFEKAVAAMLCHKSQFPSEGLRAQMEEQRKKRDSKVYFRKFVRPTEVSKNLFE